MLLVTTGDGHRRPSLRPEAGSAHKNSAVSISRASRTRRSGKLRSKTGAGPSQGFASGFLGFRMFG